MPSFFLLGVLPQVQESPTMKLHALLDWEEFRQKLKGLYRREETHGGGPTPYDPLSMFKAMLLGQWHGLSDTQLEQALKVRIDFMVFTGFEPGMAFPDATTLCRFRNRLVEAKLDQVLLRRINGQLERQGLKVSGARGAIIDATIVPSAARPERYLDVSEEGEPQVVDSADAEARWVKKGKAAFYGYRGYAVVDSQEGYVEHVEMHRANEAEVNKLIGVLDLLSPGVEAVLADKGYASQANRQALRDRGINDLIQYKAQRNTPLESWQRRANRLIATLRFKVEQAFGTLKRRFHMGRARYFGLAKVQAQMCWAALGMNLLKAHRKLQRMALDRTGAPA
jgi:Transposase and inactivated derivatives, IS5 family